jgi:heme exporter protein D
MTRTLGEFLAMGGYGTYVWTSYALSLAVLVANLWLPWRRERRLRRELARSPAVTREASQ